MACPSCGRKIDPNAYGWWPDVGRVCWSCATARADYDGPMVGWGMNHEYEEEPEGMLKAPIGAVQLGEAESDLERDRRG